MFRIMGAVLVFFAFPHAHGTTVVLRLQTPAIAGTQQTSGTQSWFPENNAFYSDVSNNGFDITVSYDASSTSFGSSSLGALFNATILSGHIGSATDLDAFTLVAALSTVAGKRQLMFVATENPFGILPIGYIRNLAIAGLIDQDNVLSATALPSAADLVSLIDDSYSEVRNERNSNGVQGTRSRNGSLSFSVVPEPSIYLLLSSTLLIISCRRSRFGC
jgi:hypothetical protein